jgi:hypothetical protein
MTTPTDNTLDGTASVITSARWYDDNRFKSSWEEEHFRWVSAICMELPFVACGLCSSDNSLEKLLVDLLQTLGIDSALFLYDELKLNFAEQPTSMPSSSTIN